MESKDEVMQLIHSFNSGNKDSFVQILNIVKEPVYKTIYTFVGNEENAVDVFDEVLYKAYVNLPTLKHPEFFKTWIIRIAINESKNYLKKVSKIISFDEYGSIDNFNTEENKMNGIQIAYNTDDKIDFENALNKLNVDYKSILLMKFYLNFTFEEIANSMQKPTGTIKTWYYKALENLKELLQHSAKEVHGKWIILMNKS